MNKLTRTFFVAGIALATLLTCAACASPSAEQSSSAPASASSSAASASASSSAAPVSASASASSSAAASSSSSKALPANPADSRSADEIIDSVLEYFDQISAIPRQSGNEKQISDYLVNWAEEKGFEVNQDAANNVIFDVPATEGLESLPLVGLQTHMDMTCVAAAGVSYNPASDPIKPVRNDDAGTLAADGTSLGADGGLGMAMIMDLCNGNASHGPLRVIITTDEEEGFTGVDSLSQDVVSGLDYLINVDGEESDTVTVSSAGGENLTATGSLEIIETMGNAAMIITLDGLKGGHSGFQINEGRCNAIRAMAGLVRFLQDSNVAFELASIEGGTAESVIPASARATIVFASEDANTIRDLVSTYESNLKNDYGSVETTLSLRTAGADLPGWVFTPESTADVIGYALNVIDGVHSISTDVEGFVESSSNLGVFNANTNDGFRAVSFIRSSNRDRLSEIEQQQANQAAACGFASETSAYTSPWPYNPDSKLSPLCKNVYENLQGQSMDEMIIHATLECGTFADMKPGLDIVSLGPDVRNANSPEETVDIDSIAVVWRTIAGVLAQIS